MGESLSARVSFGLNQQPYFQLEEALLFPTIAGTSLFAQRGETR
jgi:hypothetical protein